MMPTKSEQATIAKQDLLRTMKDRFQSVLQHPAWEAWRTEAKLCYEYKDGDQWSAADKAVLRKRKQPATVNNQIKVLYDWTIGQYAGNRTHALYTGRNTPADDLSHHTMSALKLHVEQNSNYEFQERDMFEDGVITGFGVLDIRPKYNPLVQAEEVTMEAVDCFEFGPDPYSRNYDWNRDAKFLCRWKWIDANDIKRMWPSHAAAINNIFAESDAPGIDADVWDREMSLYVDVQRKRLRVVEQWWKETKSITVVYLPDGTSQEIPVELKVKAEKIPNVRVENETKKVLHSGFFTSELLLEHIEDPHKGITIYPYVPYFDNRKKTGEPYGFVSTVRSMQDSVNKRGSKSVHLLSANSVVAEENQITDKEEFATQYNSPAGIAEVKGGALSGGRIKFDSNTDVAVVHANFQQADIMSMRLISGINPEAVNAPSPIRSGIGLAKKEQAANVVASPKFDNLRRTKVLAAKLLLEYFAKYYTGPMTFRITDDPAMGDFASKVYALNLLDPNTNQVANVGQWAYDVVVDDIPNVAAMHQNQTQILAQTLPAISQMHPAYAMILVQSLDLKDKDKILALLQQALQSQQQTAPTQQFNVGV